MAVLVPSMFQAFDNSGNFLVNGRLYFFLAGTDTPAAVYTNAGGGTAHSHPVTLDARGEASVWLDPAVSYKRVLKTSLDATLYTEDNVQAPTASTMVFTPAGTGAVATTVQAKLREHRSVLDFGAVGDGVNDDTAEIQAGIDAVEAAGGGTLWFPEGTYKVSATLLVDSNNVNLVGDGWNTVLTRSGDYGYTIKFSGNDATGTSLDYCGLSNMRLVATGLMSSGAHVWLNGVFLFVGANVHCTDGFHTFRLSGARRCYLDNWEGVYADLHGGVATGRKGWLFDAAAATYAHPSCAAVFIDGFNIQGPSSATGLYDYGMYATCADGIWPSNGHLGAAAVANICLSAEDASNQLGIFKVVNLEIDSICTGSAAIQCKGSANDIFLAKFTNLDLHGGASGYYGLLVDAGTNLDGLEIATCTTFNFDRDGMRLLGGRNYKFTGWNSRGNSRETVNTYSGIFLKDVAGAQFRGGGSGEDPLGAVAILTQKYGIEIDTGCSGISGNMDLEGNLSGSIGGAGAAQYRWEGGGLEKTPATRVERNLIPVGGIGFGGAAYLDGNALTGIADSKLFTMALLVRFQNASAATEAVLDATGSSGLIQRTAGGNLFVLAKNQAGVVILSQTTSGATMAAAGTYRILISVDLGNALCKIYINDVLQTLQGGGTLTNDTMAFTAPAVLEYSLGATTTGTNFLTGDLYMAWFADGVYVDLDTTANRRGWFTKGGVLEVLGAKGTGPTGSQPRMFQCYDDFDEWKFPRGSATTTWTVNGTPTVVTTEDYTYDQTLLHAVTTTAAAHKVGRYVQTLTANRAGGTTTLDLTYLASKSTPGRQLTLRTTQAQTVVSGASDVVPIAGGAASTAILAATAGKFAVIELNADGTTWTIIHAN